MRDIYTARANLENAVASALHRATGDGLRSVDALTLIDHTVERLRRDETLFDFRSGVRQPQP